MSEPKSPWSLHIHCVGHPLSSLTDPHLQMEIKSFPFWKEMESLSGLHEDRNQP